MSDLVLSIKLEGDAGDLNGEIRISRQEFEKLEKSTEKTGKAAGRSSKEIHQLGRQFSEFGREAERLNRVNTNLARTLGTLVGTAVGAVGISSLTRSFVEAASTAENYETRLKILLGSTEEGSRLFDEMATYASRVPFEFEAIMGSATQLAGVLKGGVDEISEWMPLIGDLAAASGLGIQETTEQVARMLSAGAASADRFRERGILAMLGFEAGVKYSAEETRQQLMESWKKTNSQFRGATDELANTWDGLMSMFSDKWFAFRNEVADAGLFDELKGEAKELLGTIDQLKADGTLKEWAQTTSDSLIWMGQHLDEAAIGLTGLMIARSLGPMFNNAAVAINTYTAAQIRANLAMRTGMAAGTALRGVMGALGGPAGLIITGAAALAIWASNSADAASETENYAEKLAVLEGNLKKAELAQLNASIARAEEDRRKLDSQIKGTSGKEFADLFNKRGDINRYLNEAKRRAQELASTSDDMGKSGTRALRNIGEGADDAKKKLDELKKSGQALMDTLFPEEAAFDKYAEQLNLISQMRQTGLIDVEKEQEAIDQLTLQYLDLDEEVKETGKTSSKTMKSMAQDTSKAMRIIQQSTDRAMWSAENSFVNFAKTGKLEIRDLIDTILDEMLRLLFRQNFASGGTSLFSGLFGGMFGGGGDFSSTPGIDLGSFGGATPIQGSSWLSGLTSLFSFGDGGIMTSAGPMPLQKYGDGGVVNGPQFRVAGERYQPEAIIPLPNGRSVPVEMTGGGSPSIVFSPNYNITAGSGADKAEIYAIARRTSDEAVAKLMQQINRGGNTAKIVGRRR